MISDPLAAVERALIAGGFLVLFFVLPHALEGDDYVRFHDLQQLLHHGRLTDSKFSLVMPLVSAPFVLLGRAVESEAWWATRFNVLVVAAGAGIAWRLVRDRVDGAVLRRTLLAVLFASLLTNRLRTYDSDVLSATLVAIGIACVVRRRSVLAGWAAIALGAANRPALVLALVPLVAYEAFRTRRLRPFGWLALAAVLVAVEAWVRRGSPFDTGYSNDHGYRTIVPYSGLAGFSFPFLLGLASILFSSGRGLLFFMPGLALWLASGTRRAAAEVRPLLFPMLLVVLGLVFVYSKWWAWYGGITWGPRFFVFGALPASLLLAVRIGRAGESAGADLLSLAVLALSAWVGLAGAISPHPEPALCSARRYALESLCWYVPPYSSLWQPVLHPSDASGLNLLLVGWCAAVFSVLALPLVSSLADTLRTRRPGRELLCGWRL